MGLKVNEREWVEVRRRLDERQSVISKLIKYIPLKYIHLNVHIKTQTEEGESY